jgi:hypothetical protein
MEDCDDMKRDIDMLISALVESDDSIPHFSIIREAEARGWISIRHANMVRNAWIDESVPFRPDSETVRRLLIQLRHDIMRNYLKEKTK